MIIILEFLTIPDFAALHPGYNPIRGRSAPYEKPSYYYSSKFAWPAQMIWKLNGLGVGNSSRQGAKAPSDSDEPSSRTKERDLRQISLFVRNDNTRSLRPLRPSASLRTCFAGDTPRFGCGSAAL